MVLFFDNNMEKVVDEDMVVFYSSFLHYALRVDKNAATLIEFLMENGSGNEISIDNILKILPKFEHKEIEDTLEELSSTQLFYKDSMSYRLNNFNLLRDEVKKIDIVQAYVHLTFRCNLNCEYCYNKDKLNSCKDLPLYSMKYIIDTLKENGVKELVFTGGEPTLYKYFKEIVDYAYEKGFFIEVLSNGTTLQSLDDDTIKKVDSFMISLDGIDKEKTHRKNSEKFSVLNQIVNLKERGGKVKVRSVLTKKNGEEIKKLKEYLFEREIDHVEALYIPASKEEFDLIPDLNLIKQSDDEFELCDITDCGAGQTIIAINPEGKIYPCQSLMLDEFYITNIFNENWMNELKNSRISQYFLNRKNSEIEGCENCKVRTICSGGCRSIAYNVYNDIEHKIDYLCDFFMEESKNSIKNIKFN